MESEIKRIVLIDKPADGHTNMKKDADLLTEASEKNRFCIRLYTWDGPWISLGYHQAKDVDGELIAPGLRHEHCRELGVGLVLRPTGGKAVLHGHDLTITIACPLTALAVKSSNVKKAYRVLAGYLTTWLTAAGIPAALGEDLLPKIPGQREPIRSADCFQFISPNDIVDKRNMRKLVGCALRLTSDSVLMQCSMPVNSPLVNPNKVFENPYFGEVLDLDIGILIERIASVCQSDIFAIKPVVS